MKEENERIYKRKNWFIYPFFAWNLQIFNMLFENLFFRNIAEHHINSRDAKQAWRVIDNDIKSTCKQKQQKKVPENILKQKGDDQLE